MVGGLRTHAASSHPPSERAGQSNANHFLPYTPEILYISCLGHQRQSGRHGKIKKCVQEALDQCFGGCSATISSPTVPSDVIIGNLEQSRAKSCG